VGKLDTTPAKLNAVNIDAFSRCAVTARIRGWSECGD
jgi:hypothetical protein